VDAQSKLTPVEQKRFRTEYPKTQMFTKTDLAKFENVFDDHPRWVNLGSQKNFARYALRIGEEWGKSSTSFNERYFQRAIARAIIFRHTEKGVSQQPWYAGGYRANIVAYAVAAIGEVCRRHGKELPWNRIWREQGTFIPLDSALMIAAQFVTAFILNPPSGISNISEWCKKELCWSRICDRLGELSNELPQQFIEELISADEARADERQGKKDQLVEDGIKAQIVVCDIPAAMWRLVLQEGQRRKLLSSKEVDCVRIAQQIPNKVPTERQCVVILGALAKLNQDGFVLPV
jgi:hypothetical protein